MLRFIYFVRSYVRSECVCVHMSVILHSRESQTVGKGRERERTLLTTVYTSSAEYVQWLHFNERLKCAYFKCMYFGYMMGSSEWQISNAEMKYWTHCFCCDKGCKNMWKSNGMFFSLSIIFFYSSFLLCSMAIIINRIGMVVVVCVQWHYGYLFVYNYFFIQKINK